MTAVRYSVPAEAAEPMFPIMRGPNVPWSLIAPYEHQARTNHGQTLKRLAERGGLSISEAMAVMSSVRYEKRPTATPTVEDWLDFIAERKARAESRPPPAEALAVGAVTTAMIDAAMVEVQNLHPPMRRSDCERLIRAALRINNRPTGHVAIEHDGFAGDIVGHYLTREGKRGVVVQQDGTLVVHVYGEKWLNRSEGGRDG